MRMPQQLPKKLYCHCNSGIVKNIKVVTAVDKVTFGREKEKKGKLLRLKFKPAVNRTQLKKGVARL